MEAIRRNRLYNPREGYVSYLPSELHDELDKYTCPFEVRFIPENPITEEQIARGSGSLKEVSAHSGLDIWIKSSGRNGLDIVIPFKLELSNSIDIYEFIKNIKLNNDASIKLDDSTKILYDNMTYSIIFKSKLLSSKKDLYITIPLCIQFIQELWRFREYLGNWNMLWLD